MKRENLKVLEQLNKDNTLSQRCLSDLLHFSLGKINNIMKDLISNGYIDDNHRLTIKAINYIADIKPANAIILAAGAGFRMIPISSQVNKAFIEVKGEILIERIIRQLHIVGILNISIVVGYMKEQFDYLIDKFGVKLIVNMQYGKTNSLYSLSCVKEQICNTYIIPCDLYFKINPFSPNEFYSWYLLTDEYDNTSYFKINAVNKLTYSNMGGGNRMVGLSYITKEDAILVKGNLHKLYIKQGVFYEEALLNKGKCLVDFKIIDNTSINEFNTYDDLQSFDILSSTLQVEIFDILKKTLDVNLSEINNIIALKKGMTNKSFLFNCNCKKYIMRVPGEGTEKLIDRQCEFNVYKVIDNFNLSDRVLYFNVDNGYKLTEYIDDAHNCNYNDFTEVKECILFLKHFHQLDLKVNHYFDIFDKIEYYEKLRGNEKSIYKDYKSTKKNIYILKKYIDQQNKTYTLCHIDSVPDNFLFFNNEGRQEIRLIDWEYAAMQDPHIDIAMFAIYSMYDKKSIDRIIDIYFNYNCEANVRIKIYAYIACCGLLWSNWCEYKLLVGVEFGEYAMKQYRYAKDYYKIVKTMLGDDFYELYSR